MATSPPNPLYAFKQSIAHLKRAGDAIPAADVVGVVSLLCWTLMVICTVKYVLVILRFDNLRRRRNPVPDRPNAEAGGRAAGAITIGFMERPNVAQGLSRARVKGLKFEIMRTSFFVSRRTLLLRRSSRLGHLQDLLSVFLLRNVQRATDVFQIPPSRVAELGAQVAF